MTLVIPESISQKRALVVGSNAELKALFGWNSDAMAALYTKKPTVRNSHRRRQRN